MNISFRTLAAICSVAVSLNTGCTGQSAAIHPSDGNNRSPLVTLGGTEKEDNTLSPVTASGDDYIIPERTDRTIVFDEESVEINGGGAYAEKTCVTIKEDGVYSVSGMSGDSKLCIDADNVSLVFCGLMIGSTDGTALEYNGSGRLLISLAEGSENRISVSSKPAIKSSGDVTINGSGSLSLTGDVGIACDGAVKLCGGNINISADDDGLTGGRYVLVSGANTEIRSGGDGIRVGGKDEFGYFSIEKGSLDIKSSSDSIQTDNGIFVSGGDVTLFSGGGSSAVMHFWGDHHSYGRHGGYYTDGSKAFDFSNLVSGDGSKAGSKRGMRSGGQLEINGGSIKISSADDSIFANGEIKITDGEIVLSTGDDGVHSDKGVTVSGGSVEVSDSHCGIEGMSVDVKGGVLVLNSFADGINASGGNDIEYLGNMNEISQRYISISGGEIEIYSGGDGIDSNGTAAMSGGSLYIYASDEDEFGSICYSDSFAVSGGTLAAFGSDGATKAPSMVAHPCISVFAKAEKGSSVEVMDNTGTVVLNIVMPKRCDSMVLSSGDILEGRSYSVYVDGTLLTTVAAVKGVCGDGPNGRDMGLFDDLINGSQGNSNTAIA